MRRGRNPPAGDTAEDHRFIETLARRGYRFVAPVTAVHDPVQPEPAPASPAAGRPPRRWALPVGIAVVISGIVAVFAYLSSAITPAPAAPQTRIAVLPFENLSGDPGQEFLTDGFTEEAIARLGRLYLSDFAVIARMSSMFYKGARKRVDEIGRELKVEYVVEGSLQRGNGRLRVTAQLIRTADETHLWANTYDRAMDDVLETQSEIVTAIAEAVRAHLPASGARARNESPHPQDDPIAYELYLKGRYLWNQRTVPSTLAALEHFQRAIDRQPRYALAYAGLADAYIILGGQSHLALSESHPKARAAAMKALEIDDTLAEAHTSLAAIIADYDWDWPLAEKHFACAVALNPNDVTTHHWYSGYLMLVGRTDEAVREAEAARQIDPLSPIANVNARYQLARARRYDDAVARLQQALELFPNFGQVHSALGLTYALRRDARAALEHFQRMRQIMGETPDTVAFIGFASALAGDVPRARQALETLDRMATERHAPAIHRVLVYMGLNDLDEAFKWLERAIEAKEWPAAYLRTDPLYDPLRGDRRFNPLVARIGLPR